MFAEHYEQFGSKEGINPSNSFNAESYIAAKTKLMNETQEGGRANWTIAEVKAAFEEMVFPLLITTTCLVRMNSRLPERKLLWPMRLR